MPRYFYIHSIPLSPIIQLDIFLLFPLLFFACVQITKCIYRFAGLLRLQQIYQGLIPGNESFQVSTVRRIGNVTEALQFLRGLEEQARWDHKYVVLDCSADMAKEIVVSHVRDVTLGKRTYHYLLSGLVSILSAKIT